jgi:transposase
MTSAMNLLEVNLQQSIIALHARGWSRRRIARELDVHRVTVGRYLDAADSKSTISTLGSDVAPPAKATISTPGSEPAKEAKPAKATAGRQSLCQTFEAQIEVGLQSGLTAQRIHQDLVHDHGFTGSYQSVKRYVRRWSAAQDLPFRRMECAPGEEMQVDFGQGAWVIEEGKRRRPHLFRAVLSYSRKGYSEVVWRQDTETFVRCLEGAFRFFGGATKTVVPDNLKAAVIQADWFEPELNPKIQSFAAHYGTVIMPTKPVTPEHKGKVESGVKYAQNNAVKGRIFESLAAQNLFLAHWESTVADTRIHGTVRQQVAARFKAEQPALLPLPADLFPSFVEARRTVHRDGHIEYQKAYYSVPPEYLGHTLWVRAESRVLRVFNQRMEVIAAHVRVEAGKFATDEAHIHAHKRCVIERGANYLLQRCKLMGANSGAWAEAIYTQRGAYGLRVLQGLLGLAKKHSVNRIEQAAGLAVHRGSWRLKDLRRLLEQAENVVQVDFLEAHPLIRDLNAYRIDAFSSP